MITKTTKTKPLIHRVEIRNFKCLRSVDVDLEPLTVLIGKNDTGKSSFLQAIALMGAQAGAGLNLKPYATFGRSAEDVAVELHAAQGKRKVSSGRPEKARVVVDEGVTALKSSDFSAPYNLDPPLLRHVSQVGILDEKPLPPRGENLCAALDRLPLSRMTKLQEELRDRIPTVRELVLRPKGHGSKEITFDLVGGGRIPAQEVSDGVMLVLAFLLIVHDEHAPRVIMIEEPENGIHPKQLEYLVGQLYRLTQREDPIQIILTTHSPYVLDFVPKESVRVFARTETGDVVVKPFAGLKSVSEMLSSGFSLGEAWYNSDENEVVREPEAT